MKTFLIIISALAAFLGFCLILFFLVPICGISVLYLYVFTLISFGMCFVNNYCANTPKINTYYHGREFKPNEPRVESYLEENALEYFKDDYKEFILYQERFNRVKKYVSCINDSWLITYLAHIAMVFSICLPTVKTFEHLKFSGTVSIITAFGISISVVLLFSLISKKLFAKKIRLPDYDPADDDINIYSHNKYLERIEKPLYRRYLFSTVYGWAIIPYIIIFAVLYHYY